MASIATSTNTGASKAIKQLYLHENSADVHFCFDIGDEQFVKIPAHKAILSSLSPVFHIMFYGLIQEGNEIKITDASPDVFKQFLQFFYLAEVKLTVEHVANVMNLGNKYKVTECLDACSTFLVQCITMDTVFSMYDMAKFFEQSHLIDFCETFIKYKTSDILATETFLNCDEENLHSILKMNLPNCSNFDMIKAVFAWSKSACQRNDLDETQAINQRNQLGELLYQLPFSLLTQTEFIDVMKSNENIFTPEELFELMQLVTVKDFKPVKFVKSPKLISAKRGDIVECNRIIAQSFIIKNIESTTFSSNKLVVLHGFSCANVYEYRAATYAYFVIDFPVSNIKIIEKSIDGNDVFLFTGHIKLVTHGENRVKLPSPIIIRPGIKYEIRMEQPSQPHYHTFSTLKSTVLVGGDNTITFHGKSDLDYDDTATGLVIGLNVEYVN